MFPLDWDPNNSYRAGAPLSDGRSEGANQEKSNETRNHLESTYSYLYQPSPGEFHQYQHCVQHQSPDQEEAADRQDHEAPDCHPLSVPHIRVPSGEKLIFSNIVDTLKNILYILKLMDFESPFLT